MVLTQERVRGLVFYDPATGGLCWRATRKGVRAAGSNHDDGGRVIVIDGRRYPVPRIIWLYVYGALPADQIDHIDGDRQNNRLANLRDVSCSVNQQNRRRARTDSTTGLLGVSPCGRRFRAKIKLDGKLRHIGNFKTPEEAHASYLRAKRQLHEGCTI